MTQARNLSRLLNKKLQTYKFTATSGQTSFADSDDGGNILSYTPDNMLVTYNGVVLENGSEYTATNGTSVVLDTGADSAAEVNVYAFESVSLGGYLDTSTGGTVGGNVTVDATLTANALTVDTNTLHVDSTNNRVGIGTTSPSASLHVTGKSKFDNSITLPSFSSDPGSAAEGDIYYNTTSAQVRYYDGNLWGNINSINLAPYGAVNTSSMPHSDVNTQEVGSVKISNYGTSAWSVFTAINTNDFGGHDGHEGTPADYPAYIAIYLGDTYAINRLRITLHENSFGFFELQGSNDANTSGTFYNTGNWTSIPFVTSNNSQNNQNAGGQFSGYSDGTQLVFQYDNNIGYTHYRLYIKDTSQPAESLYTRHAGWASYYWELYRG